MKCLTSWVPAVAISVFFISLFFWSRPALTQPQVQIFTAPIDYSLLSPAFVQSPPGQIRLPANLAWTSPLPAQFYYATGGVTSNAQGERTGYSVNVQLDPQTCKSAISCTESYVDAQAIDAVSPSIREQYSLFYDSVRLGQFRATAGHPPFTHQLSNGPLVEILPWTEAGAGMGYEKAVWDECDEGGICYRYVVGLKGGDPNALIAMLETIPFGEGRRSNGQGGGIVGGDWSQLIEPTDPRGTGG